jgi:hypothetical protein
MNSMNELFNRYVSECVPELEPRTEIQRLRRSQSTSGEKA